MRKWIDKAVVLGVAISVCGPLPGCGDSGSDRVASEISQADAVSSAGQHPQDGTPPMLAVGAGRGAGASPTAIAGAPARNAAHRNMEQVHNALKPLQGLIGHWRGVTRKTIGGAAGLEEPIWTWDFLTDPDQPALVMTSDTGPYLRSARLTWRAAAAADSPNGEFELTVLDPFRTEHVYRGTLAQPVEDAPDRDGALQRTYRLEFQHVSPEKMTRFSRIDFVQENNDRYLLDVYEERDGQMNRYDTVVNERQGPSFAVEGNGASGQPCLMLHGAGTIPVEHGGETYWVCCPGCQAAFEDDPDRWIARFHRPQNEEVSGQRSAVRRTSRR